VTAAAARGLMFRRRWLAGAVALLAGCASGPAPGSARVEGQVYFPGDPLPAGSVLEIALEDTARADAPAIRIASVRIVGPRSGLSYAIDYAPTSVPAHARLSVRARITEGSRLLHVTDRFNPVGVGPGVSRVDLELRTVSHPR